MINRDKSLSAAIIVFGLLFAYYPPSAEAGCQINYLFKNSSKYRVTVKNFQVKTRGGVWKNIWTNNVGSWRYIEPNSEISPIYSAALGCNFQRRYQYLVEFRYGYESGGMGVWCKKHIYYPSGTGWTPETDINFGDVSGHCDIGQQAANNPPTVIQMEGVTGNGTVTASSGTGDSQSTTPSQNQPGSDVMSTRPGTGMLALPGAGSTSTDQQTATGTIAAPTFPQVATATTGQCLVSSTLRFPRISLRCGVSAKDETSRVAMDYLADCPLVAGDTVNVKITKGQRAMQITGRNSGGQWCNSTSRPGYYMGPCSSAKNGNQKVTVKTFIYQGNKVIASISPGSCKPVRLAPGIYRVITEHRVSGGGQPSSIALQEGGLRLQGVELIGDVTNMLSQPIQQK